jgi:hypothetical protein
MSIAAVQSTGRTPFASEAPSLNARRAVRTCKAWTSRMRSSCAPSLALAPVRATGESFLDLVRAEPSCTGDHVFLRDRRLRAGS